jgi:hypothetical protein
MLKAFHQNQNVPNFSENYQQFAAALKEKFSNQIERIIKLNQNKQQDDKNLRFINPFFCF